MLTDAPSFLSRYRICAPRPSPLYVAGGHRRALAPHVARVSGRQCPLLRGSGSEIPGARFSYPASRVCPVDASCEGYAAPPPGFPLSPTMSAAHCPTRTRTSVSRPGPTLRAASRASTSAPKRACSRYTTRHRPLQQSARGRHSGGPRALQDHAAAEGRPQDQYTPRREAQDVKVIGP